MRFHSPAILLAVVTLTSLCIAQQPSISSQNAEITALPDAPPQAQQSPLPQQDRSPQPNSQNTDGKQTKRILGIVPNFRSVSADEKLPPISKHDKFKLMLDDNFDYSNFIYVGILAGVGLAENSYPEFHHGAAAYGRYYWHSYADTFSGSGFRTATRKGATIRAAPMKSATPRKIAIGRYCEVRSIIALRPLA